jgi:hypothetical protein
MERVKRTNFHRIMSETHPDWYAYEWAGFLGADPKIIRGYKLGRLDWTPGHLHHFAEMLGVQPRELLGWDEDETWADPFEKLLRREERHALQE